MTTRYTTDHEYVRVEGTTGVVGISNFAQEQLGDIVFVELPVVGTVFSKGDEVAVVESVKAASEIYAPVSGKVIAVNDALSDNPALINTDAQGEGWILKLELADANLDETLLDEAAYADHTA